MGQGAPFAKLRFQGDRFGGAVFPVEALPELATYRDLVLEAAKSLWYADHQHRTNAPRGFEAAFGLLLVGIEAGSSMPVLARTEVLPDAIVGMTPDEAALYFEGGRRLVSDVVASASKKQALPFVSPRLGQKFAAFGSKLHTAERVQLVDPGTASGPEFTHETRDWILEAIPTVYDEDVEFIGEIVRADKVKNVFELGYDGTKRIPFDADPSLAAELLTWMRDDTIVRIRGKATHRTIGGFQKLVVDSIAMVQQDLGEAVSAPCPLPISVQLADLARLQDGWLDGDGEAYDPTLLDRAKEIFESLVDLSGVDMPYVYPSPDGAIRAEWNHPDIDVVLVLDASGARLRLLAVDSTGSRESRREQYDPDRKGLKALAASLEKLLDAGEL